MGKVWFGFVTGVGLASSFHGISSYSQPPYMTAAFPAVLSAPTLEALNVTHHSIELVWRAPSHHLGGQLEESPSESNRLLYTVQEEEVGRGRGFTNIYRYTPCTAC